MHPTHRPEEPAGGNDTVLVVDDDALVRISTAALFENAGFSALTATGGEEAIRLYRENRDRIVCVYLDMTMPGMNGEAALCELRRINADVRVIVASGSFEGEIAERFGGLGVWAFFHKLDPLDHLIARLREALRA